MHVGNSTTKTKTESMYFPATLHEAENASKNHDKTPKDLILNNGINSIPFTKKFRYLGSIITPKLNENTEIEAKIKKASSQMGILRHFFSCKDVDLRVKFGVCVARPLNCLLLPFSYQKNSGNHQVKKTS